jgi:hypothetical protein
MLQDSSSTVSDDGSIFVGGATEPPTRIATSRTVSVGLTAGFSGVSTLNYAFLNNNWYTDSSGVARYRTNGSAQNVMLDGVTGDRILFRVAAD